jgi:hypothetical protein
MTEKQERGQKKEKEEEKKKVGSKQEKKKKRKEDKKRRKGTPSPSPSPSSSSSHYVKTSNRSRNICNGPLTPVISTHICNGCCLVPVTYKRTRTALGLASTTLVTNVDFW